jgi:F420H(2)-dependent quinone reductase
VRPPKFLIRLVGRIQGVLYRLSGGRLFGRVGKVKVLLLTTTGRRSGKRRTVPLLYVPDGERYLIVASQGGHDTHPAWYLNLRANTAATMQLGSRTVDVTATELDAAERERLWPTLVAAYPAWSDYRGRTARDFPVIVLTPGGAGG